MVVDRTMWEKYEDCEYGQGCTGIGVGVEVYGREYGVEMNGRGIWTGVRDGVCVGKTE